MTYTPPFSKRLQRTFKPEQEPEGPKNVTEAMEQASAPPALPEEVAVVPEEVTPEVEVVEEVVEEIPDLGEEKLWESKMTKKELIDIAEKYYGLELTMDMKKSELIAALEAADS